MAPPTLSQPGVHAVSVSQNALKRKAEMDAQPTPALPSYVGGQDTVSKKKASTQAKKFELIGAQLVKNSIPKDEDGGRRARQVLKRKRRALDTAPDDARVDAPENAPLLQAQVPTPQSAQQPPAAEAVAPVYPDVNFSDSDRLRLPHLLQEAQLPENLLGYGADFNGGVLDDEDGEESPWRGTSDEEEKAQMYDLGFDQLAHRAQIAFYGEDFSYLKKQDRPKTRAKKYCDTCLVKKQLALFAKDDDEVDMIDTCQKCHEDIKQEEAFGDFWPTYTTPNWSAGELIRAHMLVFGYIDLIDYEPVEA